MEKIKPRLYQLTIALSLISLMLALVSSGKQREFFYIAIYVSIIGLAFEYKKNHSSTFYYSAAHFADWVT